MIDDYKTLLLIGSDININNKFNLTFPLLEEILSKGYSQIMGAVNIVYDINFALFSNEEINKIIEENNWCSFETITFLIALESKSSSKIITNYIKDFFSTHVKDCKIKITKKAEILINDLILDKEDFELISNALKIAYSLDDRIEDREFNSVDGRRKAITMRINRSKIDMIQNKDGNFVYQLISSLKIKKDNEEIQRSTMFQLIDMFKRLNKEKDYEHLMQGVYSGNVNTKTIDMSSKHWTAKT